MATQMQRYDPFRNAISLRSVMDRLFDESILHPLGNVPGDSSLMVDISETDNGYTVKASMPGVKPDDLQITVHGNVVTIRGEMHAEDEKNEEHYLMRERQVGRYERTFSLPAAVDADKAEAKFEDGVLTITLPKSESAKPKQVKVKHTSPLLQR
jgi:HSP20 family protein